MKTKKKNKKSKTVLLKIQRKISLTQIILIVSLSVILAVIGIFFNVRSERNRTDKNLQNIAETISSSPLFTENGFLQNNSYATEPLIRYLDSLKNSLYGVDVISIVGEDEVRFYHTNHNLIGSVFDGELPEFQEKNSFYIIDANGPSGKQRRAYQAIYDNENNYIGFIMVIILRENLNANISNIVITYTIITLIVIAVEILISFYLSNNIKKRLLGFEPDTISAMYVVRDNILEALDEGIIALDDKKNIIFANKSAISVFDRRGELTSNDVIGKPICSLPNGETIERALAGEDKALNIQEKNNDGLDLLIDRTPIKNGTGAVETIGILHNRAEYTRLIEDLSGSRYLIESMRANTHDFTNKLHVILGLIQMGLYEQASSYIENITLVQRATISKVMNAINEPSLAALLIGKISRASELNVRFVLREGSHYSNSDMRLPNEMLITVIGNLIENAFESMNEKIQSPETQNELLFGIFSKPNAVMITVDDTGTGIPKENIKKIFEKGFSTKGENRGTGLYQVKHLVNNFDGEIFVESQENVGTSFSVSFKK